jgi:hypothetical protein
LCPHLVGAELAVVEVGDVRPDRLVAATLADLRGQLIPTAPTVTKLVTSGMRSAVTSTIWPRICMEASGT